jgi:hypothetical protein
VSVSLTWVWLVVSGLVEGVLGYTVMLLETLLLLSLTGEHRVYTATMLLLSQLLLVPLIALVTITVGGYCHWCAL